MQTSRTKKSVEVGAGGSSSSDNDDLMVKYKSRKTGDSETPFDQGATATVEIDTPVDRDAQAIYEKSLQINKVTGCILVRYILPPLYR